MVLGIGFQHCPSHRMRKYSCRHLRVWTTRNVKIVRGSPDYLMSLYLFGNQTNANTYEIVLRNHRFGAARRMVWARQTYGFAGQKSTYRIVYEFFRVFPSDSCGVPKLVWEHHVGTERCGRNENIFLVEEASYKTRRAAPFSSMKMTERLFL